VTQLFQWGAKVVFVFHDLDRANSDELRKTLTEKIGASKTRGRACIIIPIEEIEAWLLADEDAINKSFSRPFISEIASPERIKSPKEFIERKSKAANGKPRYVHTVHNHKIAEKLNLDKVYSKCPSFRPFHDVISSL
jgi:hypothetical protein